MVLPLTTRPLTLTLTLTLSLAQGLVVSGSEDGVVHIWDLESGQLMQRLRGHADVVYDAAWSEETSMLASCSHDGTLATWWYDASQPLFCEDPHADGW